MSYCDERPVYPVDDLPWVIPVGVQTSKGVEEIGFNVSAWLDKWPDMTFEVWPTRPTETAAYPAVCQLIGDVLVWYVSDADTAFEGLGTVEVVGIAEGIRKPSGPCTTEIKKTSLGVTKEPPEGIKPYYEDMMEAAKTIREGLDGLNADLVGSDGYGGLYIVTCNGQKPNRTQAEIRAAVQARKTVLLRAGTMVYTYFQETQSSNYDEATAGKTCPTFIRPARQEEGGLRYYEVQVHEDNTVTDRGEIGKTPNPKKLKLTGAVEAEYDGSEEVTVEIPDDVYIVTVTKTGSSYTANRTYVEIMDAHNAGKMVMLVYGKRTFHSVGLQENGYTFYSFRYSNSADSIQRILFDRVAINSNDVVIVSEKVEGRAPNPFNLHFTGAVNAVYDGNKTVVVNIPTSGGGTVETADDAEVLQALADIDMMTAVGGDDYVLTDENNNILEW